MALSAGAIHSTADTVRPALQIIKPAKGIKIVSSLFFMAKAETTYLYSDCGVIEQPNADQLSDIALTTALTARAIRHGAAYCDAVVFNQRLCRKQRYHKSC